MNADPIMDRFSQPLPVEKPVVTLCHQCIYKPSTGGSSLDGRIARGYLLARERCDGCGGHWHCCLFRPADPCAACGNHIQVEPAECRNDACTNRYCTICAPKYLPPGAADGLCVTCWNYWRPRVETYRRLVAAIVEPLRRSR